MHPDERLPYATRRYTADERRVACQVARRRSHAEYVWGMYSFDDQPLARGEDTCALRAMQAADAAFAGHTQRESAKLEPPVGILDIARAAGATDPELYVDRGPPSGPTWIRLVVGAEDDGQRVADALARTEKIDAPLPWVGAEEHALKVAGRTVVVRLDRRARWTDIADGDVFFDRGDVGPAYAVRLDGCATWVLDETDDHLGASPVEPQTLGWTATMDVVLHGIEAPNAVVVARGLRTVDEMREAIRAHRAAAGVQSGRAVAG